MEVVSNDWCGSSPQFFDSSTYQVYGKHLLPGERTSTDSLGLELYLQTGYCFFGRTPYRDIKFLRANQELQDTQIIDNYYGYLRNLMTLETVEPSRVIDLIAKWIEQLEETTTGPIILPLSGGLDSRLLLSMVRNRSRLETFTYGQSWNQSKSREVKIAEALSKKMGFKWRHIELGNFSSFTREWMDFWGVSSHAHGMYQMQFYSEIRKIVPPDSIVLSGVIGDLLAGSLPMVEISKPRDLLNLSLSRNMNASAILSTLSRSANNQEIDQELEIEYESNKAIFQSKRNLDLITIQNKNMLLRYLLEVPQLYALQARSPFYDEQIGTAMLCIDDDLRYHRRWQTRFLKMQGLSNSQLESRGIPHNTLNFREVNSSHVDINLAKSSRVDNEFSTVLAHIEEGMNGLKSKILRMAVIVSQKPILSLLGRTYLRIKKKKYTNGLAMYFSYLTLVPLIYHEGKRKE